MSNPLRVASSLVAVCVLVPAAGWSIDPQRSWVELVSSNGYTGVVMNLESREVHHFREHVYATEEPVWNADGSELWLPTEPGGSCYKPQVVWSRDLLNDAYFGFRARGSSAWLPSVPVDLDASGYDAPTGLEGHSGGTGIMRMVQVHEGAELTFTTRVFAPWQAGWASFVMALEVTNTGATATGPLDLFALINPNVGYGRPGPRSETGADFETITEREDGALVEQGFAGLIHMLPLPAPRVTTHTPALFFDHVRDNLAGDLPEASSSPVLGTGNAGAFQWHIDDLAPGASTSVAVVVSHDPNPDFVTGRVAAVNAWVGGRDVAAIVNDERGVWAELFDTVARIPEGLSDTAADLWRHSAVILHMAQVRESSYWLRPDRERDADRFTGIDGAVTQVGGTGVVREHNGAGALLASLPPGEWTYAWVRDGSYGLVGLTDGGFYEEARSGLEFFLNAEANRYVDFGELDTVPLGDYALSLTRYHGFGIEESDTTCNGDLNFEWDGFGLFLWALRHYVDTSGDTSIVSEYWDLIRTRIGDVTLGLIEPDTGLMHPDSSIWEVHWFGREKTFAYTSITAARGLCDLASLAREHGDAAAAERYEQGGRRLRQAIAERLTTPSGAIASNTEELATGTGYWDAAVVEAVAMGLFDPRGPIATQTMNAIRANLTVPSGRGVFRNDDQYDAHDLTPWGGPYDSLEWVFLDYRVSIAARLVGDDAWADALQGWVRDQSALNFMLIAENYDQNTGVYRNNAPMIGFGAGSYLTAERQRATEPLLREDPACGVYYEDDPDFGPATPGEDAGPTDAGDAGDVDPADASDASDVPDADPADADDGTTLADDQVDPPDTVTDGDSDSGDDSGDPDTSDAAVDPEPDAEQVDASDTSSGRDTGGSGDAGPDADTSGGERGCTASQTGPLAPLWAAVAALLAVRRRRARCG